MREMKKVKEGDLIQTCYICDGLDIIILICLLVLLLLVLIYSPRRITEYMYQEKDIYHKTILFENCFDYSDGWKLCK